MIIPYDKVKDKDSLASIITVTFNAENFLEKTIVSVINQSYKNIEHIVIDGGSEDGTLSIIKKYEKEISFWISEPDKGIYDAMNKGISVSRGDIVGILNAGDEYADDAISLVVNCYQAQDPAPIIMGNCKIYQSVKNDYWVTVSGNPKKLPYKMPPHPSIFVPLCTYQAIGLFDCTFMIAADYEFLCRCYISQVPFLHLNRTIAVASSPGISSNYYLSEIECFRARLKNRMSLSVAVFMLIFAVTKITVRRVLEILKVWHLVEKARHTSTR